MEYMFKIPLRYISGLELSLIARCFGLFYNIGFIIRSKLQKRSFYNTVAHPEELNIMFNVNQQNGVNQAVLIVGSFDIVGKKNGFITLPFNIDNEINFNDLPHNVYHVVKKLIDEN